MVRVHPLQPKKTTGSRKEQGKRMLCRLADGGHTEAASTNGPRFSGGQKGYGLMGG